MQILDNTLNRLKKSKPLKGVTLGFCLHITKETSVLLIGAKELGAKVAACGGKLDGGILQCLHLTFLEQYGHLDERKSHQLHDNHFD